MITVTFFKKEDLLYGYHSSGHAKYASYGQDIVCAGVSAILFSVAAALEERTTHLFVETNDTKGTMTVKITDDIFKQDDIQAILRVAQVGIEGIRQEYSKHIEMKSKED